MQEVVKHRFTQSGRFMGVDASSEKAEERRSQQGLIRGDKIYLESAFCFFLFFFYLRTLGSAHSAAQVLPSPLEMHEN